jgi:radical SAM superfamily enzyme YgiQ (UPF0313 family)
MICEPLDLEYVAARAEQLGHSVDIVDLILESEPLEHFLAQKDYAVLGLTGYLPHVRIIRDLALAAKRHKPGLVTLVGGVHAEVLPEDFADAAIDFVLRDNALVSLAPLLAGLEECLGSGAVDRDASFARIRREIAGLWAPGKERCPVETSFDFPWPDRSKTQKYRHKYSYGFHNHSASLKTSFGCPYKCEFCFCISITQNNYFERDLKDVIAELKTIRETNVFIVDDNFLLRRERVLEFCRLIREHGLQKRFILFGRADFITANVDVMRELKDAGVRAVFIGVESLKQKDLAALEKNCSVETNTQALRIIEDLGLNFYAGLLAGPDWTTRDFDNLIKFLKTFKYPIFNLQPITPLPGTPFYDKVKTDVVIPRRAYQLWDLAHLLFRPEHMSAGQFYKNILRVYYNTSSTPRMHLYLLRAFGLRAYLRTLKGSILITLQYLRLVWQG